MPPTVLGTRQTTPPAAVSRTVTQTAHGFTAGQILYYTGTAYALARADVGATAEAVGVVGPSPATNTFTLVAYGYVSGLSGLTAGSVYFVSAGTAGLLTATEPSTAGQISKPLFVADSTTSGYVINYRGLTIGGTAAPLTNTPVLLSSTSGINGKTVGTTTLYTVPTGYTAWVTAAVVTCTAASAITAGPTLGIGIATNEDDIFAVSGMTALTTAGLTFNFAAVGMSRNAPAGSVIKAGLDTAATGTSQTLAIDLWGYVR